MGSDADEHEELMQALSEANYQSDLDAAIAERDRLRRELESLREHVRLAHDTAVQDAIDRAFGGASQAQYMESSGVRDALTLVLDRIDAILTGEGER